MQDSFRFKKWTLFASSVCDFIFELPYTSVESYARLYVKIRFFFFRMVRRPHVHISYHVPGIYTAASSSYCCRRSLQQVHMYPDRTCTQKKSEAVRIEPPPPSPSICRLYTRSSRTLFWPQAGGNDTRMPSVVGETRASCRLSITVGHDQTQAPSDSSIYIRVYTDCQPELVDK